MVPQPPTIQESSTTPFLNLPDARPWLRQRRDRRPDRPGRNHWHQLARLTDTDTLVDNLTVTATSSNQAVVSNANLNLTGSGPAVP